jgi:hypothetical protein
MRREPALAPGLRITVLMSIPDSSSPGNDRDLERDYWAIYNNRQCVATALPSPLRLSNVSQCLSGNVG